MRGSNIYSYSVSQFDRNSFSIAYQPKFKMAATVRTIVSHPKLFDCPIPFSKGVLVDKTLYITGQVGWTKEGKLVEGIEAQTRVALENMGYVLEAAGANHSNVVQVTILMKDLVNDAPKMNEVYKTFFKDNIPARACYQVARLPDDALVELVAVAIVGDIVNKKL